MGNSYSLPMPTMRKPPLWSKPGDICECKIDGIGLLRNSIALEAAGPGCMTWARE
jgi:2-keto-4-pentenoate hydratase/2-oxohepta-3-ene-1,7-dioic acid hydratase in catechol pathway